MLSYDKKIVKDILNIFYSLDNLSTVDILSTVAAECYSADPKYANSFLLKIWF